MKQWMSSREFRSQSYFIIAFCLLIFITGISGDSVWVVKIQRMELMEYVLLVFAGYRIAEFLLRSPVLQELRDLIAHKFGLVQPSIWGVSMIASFVTAIVYLAIPEITLFLFVCAISTAVSLLDKLRQV